MAGEKEGPAPRTGRRRFWSYRRLWSAIALVAIVVLFARDNEPFLRTVQQTDQAIADAIRPVTPGALIAGFDARAAECDYRWLVYCAAKPSRADCLRSDDACGFGNLDRGSGYLAAAWRTIRALAQLPDTTWYAIRMAWQDGYVTLGLLIAFITINVAVTTRVPILLWPISLPVTTALASGLSWLVQHALLLGTGTLGVLIQLLLGSYLAPHVVVAAFEYIRGANELGDVVHKSAEVIGRTPHAQG